MAWPWRAPWTTRLPAPRCATRSASTSKLAIGGARPPHSARGSFPPGGPGLPELEAEAERVARIQHEGVESGAIRAASDLGDHRRVIVGLGLGHHAGPETLAHDALV